MEVDSATFLSPFFSTIQADSSRSLDVFGISFDGFSAIVHLSAGTRQPGALVPVDSAVKLPRNDNKKKSSKNTLW